MILNNFPYGWIEELRISDSYSVKNLKPLLSWLG